MSLSQEMKDQLDRSFNWRLTNVPELQPPVLVVLDYSPSSDQRPVSIAFDFTGGRKCWLSEQQVRRIDGRGPNPYMDYREFTFAGRRFHPYSIEAFPRDIFEDIKQFDNACWRLYQHVVGDSQS